MDSLLQGTDNNVFTISMPAIFCSFPLKIHPEAPHLLEVGDASLQEWCTRIMAACERFQLPVAHLFTVEHNVNSAYGLLVTLYFANAVSTQRLVPALKLMNWFFLFDTCVDELRMFGADPAKSTHIINTVLAIFNKPTPSAAGDESVTAPVRPSHGTAHEEVAHIVAGYAAEWWSDMCVDMPLSQQARFAEIFADYLSCILKETPFRSAQTLPDVEGYLRIRAHSIAWYPLNMLTEYSLCMEIGQEAITSPLLLALKQSVCESIILVNDVMSFSKEYERGDAFNIIMVLCFQKLKQATAPGGGPAALSSELATPQMLQESMNEACEMIKQTDHKCVSAMENIKKNQKLMEIPRMGAFLEAMGNYVAGNIYWHLISERYWPQVSFDFYGLPPHQIVQDMAKNLVSRPVLLRRPRSPAQATP